MSRRRRLSPPVIPDELIHEILVKLPVESFWRLRRVCKSWKILISNPQFAKDHLHSSTMTHPRLAIVYDDSNNARTYSMNSFFENPPTLTEIFTLTLGGKRNHFVGSINGLLCLCDRNGYFRLWNPFTRLVSRISPAFPGESSRIPYDAFFGYDKVNDKYKVLAFRAEVGNGVLKMVARLYTFCESESSWRDLPFCPTSTRGSRQTFLNGNLHWLIKRGDGYDKVIISFDVEKETHGEVLLPHELEGKAGGIDLYVSNKYLYVWQPFYQTHFVLWLMKEYGVQESWTKVMTIPLPSRYCICRCNAPHLSPFCILENDVVVLRTTC